MRIRSFALRQCRRIISRRPVARGFVLAIAVSAVMVVLSACIKSDSADQASTQIGLSRYALAAGPIALPGIGNDASDIVYSPVTGTLFLITNAPTAIHELRADGEAIRRIRLTGFNDTEGITHIRDDHFAIIEERRNVLALITITPETLAIDRAEARLIELTDAMTGNKGPEGITYDPLARRLLVVKERGPRGFYAVRDWEKAGDPPAIDYARLLPWEWQEMADLSAIHHDPASDHLLILSDESRRLEERSRDGFRLDHLALTRGQGGLKEDIPQPEGVAIAPDGTIFICSEPNLLYIFKKNPRG